MCLISLDAWNIGSLTGKSLEVN